MTRGSVLHLRRLLLFGVMILSHGVAAEVAAPGLAWDALEKRYVAKEGEEEANLQFEVTNRSDHPIEIVGTATSCHCTVATPPRHPWIVSPGATEALRVTVDLRSRRGRLTKTVYVDTAEGEQMLQIDVEVPLPPTLRREMNATLALADRQAVLHGDCASCHVKPTIGKAGAELFQTACLICHGAEHRASMVPDLMVAKAPRDGTYWEKWIREGGVGTLMPAFDLARNGSLDETQIKSLVEYLVATLPSQPPSK